MDTARDCTSSQRAHQALLLLLLQLLHLRRLLLLLLTQRLQGGLDLGSHLLPLHLACSER